MTRGIPSRALFEYKLKDILQRRPLRLCPCLRNRAAASWFGPPTRLFYSSKRATKQTCGMAGFFDFRMYSTRRREVRTKFFCSHGTSAGQGRYLRVILSGLVAILKWQQGNSARLTSLLNVSDLGEPGTCHQRVDGAEVSHGD